MAGIEKQQAAAPGQHILHAARHLLACGEADHGLAQQALAGLQVARQPARGARQHAQVRRLNAVQVFTRRLAQGPAGACADQAKMLGSGAVAG
jgi:hypothetical protein